MSIIIWENKPPQAAQFGYLQHFIFSLNELVFEGSVIYFGDFANHIVAKIY